MKIITMAVLNTSSTIPSVIVAFAFFYRFVALFIEFLHFFLTFLFIRFGIDDLIEPSKIG